MFYQFLLISLSTLFNIISGRIDPFTFEGTYKITISGEERRLSVCQNKDGQVFWGLDKLLSDDDERLNYAYAMGRDSNAIEKRKIKGKEHNVYEAAGDSFWFKENELGAHTIQFYLKYNENKKYLKYTLSTAMFKDDPNSINNVYALEKVSEDVLGECWIPGDLSLDDIKFPVTSITDSTSDMNGFGDNIVFMGTDKNNECWGWWEILPNSFVDGGLIAQSTTNQFEFDNKLRISQGIWPNNPCCLRFTAIELYEFYDNYQYDNSILLTWKCEGTNQGAILRSFETDRDFGECPLF